MSEFGGNEMLGDENWTIVRPGAFSVTGIGIVGVTSEKDGVPLIPTFHVPFCATAGMPRMPTFQVPDCDTAGVLVTLTLGVFATFTLGVPVIVTLPATGSGDGARTGIGFASVLTTVTGADGGVCGSANACGATATSRVAQPALTEFPMMCMFICDPFPRKKPNDPFTTWSLCGEMIRPAQRSASCVAVGAVDRAARLH